MPICIAEHTFPLALNIESVIYCRKLKKEKKMKSKSILAILAVIALSIPSCVSMNGHLDKDGAGLGAKVSCPKHAEHSVGADVGVHW
jgi:hypothetical protein